MYYDPQTNQPRRSKVYLVCGAPASGKTTYVKQHKEPERLISEDNPNPNYRPPMGGNPTCS